MLNKPITCKGDSLDDRSDHMEVIDQLITGPMRLDVLCVVFTSERRFLDVVASMLDDDLLALADKETGPIEHREARAVLASPVRWTSCDLCLTDNGIAAFRG